MLGVFDSGFGGLHVLRGIVQRLPQYSYIYLGDSARAPYGERSQEDIYRFTKQGVDFLFAHGTQLVVLACNTASSEALRKIQGEYGAEKKVLGVLIPFAEAGGGPPGGAPAASASLRRAVRCARAHSFAR